MSAYPGLIASTIFSFLGFITILPILGIWALVVALAALADILNRRSLRSAYGLQAAVLSCFCFGLVVKRIPLKAGFALSRPAFEELLQTAEVPKEDGQRSQELSRWIGIYRVDRWGKDKRGGVYFRTGTGMDMIDQMSYGFVFQPNPKGSPFGAASYSHSRLSGDWRTFSVSDDYY